MNKEQIEIAVALIKSHIFNSFEEVNDVIKNGMVQVYQQNSIAEIAKNHYFDLWNFIKGNALKNEPEMINLIDDFLNVADWENVGEQIRKNSTFIKVKEGLWV